MPEARARSTLPAKGVNIPGLARVAWDERPVAQSVSGLVLQPRALGKKVAPRTSPTTSASVAEVQDVPALLLNIGMKTSIPPRSNLASLLGGGRSSSDTWSTTTGSFNTTGSGSILSQRTAFSCPCTPRRREVMAMKSTDVTSKNNCAALAWHQQFPEVPAQLYRRLEYGQINQTGTPRENTLFGPNTFNSWATTSKRVHNGEPSPA